MQKAMKELSVSQAQKQFTSLLSEVTTIVDKKSHRKKAVLIPYDLYEKLVNKKESKSPVNKMELDEFVGLLSDDFETDDARYNAIIK